MSHDKISSQLLLIVNDVSNDERSEILLQMATHWFTTTLLMLSGNVTCTNTYTRTCIARLVRKCTYLITKQLHTVVYIMFLCTDTIGSWDNVHLQKPMKQFLMDFKG